MHLSLLLSLNAKALAHLASLGEASALLIGILMNICCLTESLFLSSYRAPANTKCRGIQQALNCTVVGSPPDPPKLTEEIVSPF